MKIGEVFELIKEFPFSFLNQIPEEHRIYAMLAAYTLLIELYAVFMWEFYKFLRKI